MPRAKTIRIPSLEPLRTEAERRFDIRHRARHHSDVEFSARGWASMNFIRRAVGARTRSQAVNAALYGFALRLGMPEWDGPETQGACAVEEHAAPALA